MENVLTKIISDFGTLNTVDSPWRMSPNQTPDAKNVYVRDGIIRKRPALKRRYSVALPAYVTGSETANATQAAFIWQYATQAVGTERWGDTFDDLPETDLDGQVGYTKVAGKTGNNIVVSTTTPINGTKSALASVGNAGDPVLSYTPAPFFSAAHGSIYRQIFPTAYSYQRGVLMWKVLPKRSYPAGGTLRVWEAGMLLGGDATRALLVSARGLSNDGDTGTDMDILVYGHSGSNNVLSSREDDLIPFDSSLGVLDFTLVWQEDGSWNLTVSQGTNTWRTGTSTTDNIGYLGIASPDRILLGGGCTDNETGNVAEFDDISVMTDLETADKFSKIFLVQGWGGIYPRIISGSVADVDTAWTDVGTAAETRGGMVTPVLFNQSCVLAASPLSNSPLKLWYNGSAWETIAIDGPPPPMSTAVAYRNMLLGAADSGLTRFSEIGNMEKWYLTNSITHENTPWNVSSYYKMGGIVIANTEHGIYIIQGYGQNSLRSDPLVRAIGSGEIFGCSGGDDFMYLIGHASRRRLSFIPGWNPYQGIYRITRDGGYAAVSNPIANSELFKSSPQWSGWRTDVVLGYDIGRDVLYVLAPRYNPLRALSPGAEQNVFVMTPGDNWAKWTFNANYGLTYICPEGLGLGTAGLPTGFGTSVLCGGSGKAGYNYVFYFDEGYRGQGYSPAAMDVDTDGNQTVTFDSYWMTPIIAPGEPSPSDVIQEIYLFGKQTSGTGVTVQFRVDGTSAWTTAGGSGTVWTLQQWGTRVPIKARGRTIQFKFTFATDSVEPEIHGFEINYKPIARFDG